MIRRLTQDELETERTRRPGLIPVAFRSADELVWLDLTDLHCREGFFSESLEVYAREKGDRREGFLTAIDTLFSPAAVEGSLPPTGFIFHAGRCGSTLLAKSLARSSRNIVFSEASLHNQAWKVAGARTVEGYRRLILAMGRPRLPSHSRHLIKFTSFNIMQYGLIREAFPDVPALFLYREPGAMLASYRLGAPGWLGRDAGIGAVWDSAEAAIDAFYRAALGVRTPGFRTLDYAELKPSVLPSILEFFGMDATGEELADMEAEFAWDAKSGLTAKPFVRPVREIPAPPEVLERLYGELRAAQSLANSR